MTLGGFTFVLHTHMPFYRGAGKWPHGEENLHEVMAETYVPILEALTDLYEAGVKAKVTIGITPVLAEQLADAMIKDNFEAYVAQEMAGAKPISSDSRRAASCTFTTSRTSTSITTAIFSRLSGSASTGTLLAASVIYSTRA